MTTPASSSERVTELKRLLRAGNHAEALAQIDALLVSHPTHAPLYWHQVLCLEALKRPDEALAAVQRLIELKADYAPAWVKRAELSEWLRPPYAGFESDVRTALRLDPQLARAHRALALWLRRQDAPAQAAGALERALTLDPDDAEALLLRATWTEAAAGRIDQGEDPLPQPLGGPLSRQKLASAVRDLGRALRRKPDPRTLLKRAALAQKLGEHGEVIADCERALTLLNEGDPRRALAEQLRRRSLTERSR